MAPENIQLNGRNWVDVYVGGQVRLRRMQLRFSQENLGASIGVTSQQVQKYEKGINRIGASRLLDIAVCLNVPISFFFPKSESDSLLSAVRPAEPIGATAQPKVTPEAMELVQIFAEITNPDLRTTIVSLVRVLSEQHQ